MNTQELAEHVAGDTGLTKAEARKVIDSVITAIADKVSSGEEVVLSGFGKFSVSHTQERKGRNPATGAEMTIAASRKAKFAAAKGLKDKLAI